jgi:hypothetical protein
VGWRIQLDKYGLGEVRMSTRFGPPVAGAIDYELNGELLIPSATETNRFHTRSERFLRIRRQTNRPSWSAEHPDGSRADYGDREDALIKDPSGQVLEWLLQSVTSATGNQVRIEYFRPATDPGVAYPQRIAYSYRGSSPVGDLREVLFLWEPRPDVITDFMGFTKRVIGLRLKEIQVRVGGEPFQRRTFSYASTGISRLQTTQLFGTDCPHDETSPAANCDSLPAQKFTYSTHQVPAGATTYWQPGDPNTLPVPIQRMINNFSGEGGVRFGDVNGDGLPDLVQAYRNEIGTLTQGVYLNTGSDWAPTPDPTYTASFKAIRARAYRTTDPCASPSFRDAGLLPVSFFDVPPILF